MYKICPTQFGKYDIFIHSYHILKSRNKMLTQSAPNWEMNKIQALKKWMYY